MKKETTSQSRILIGVLFLAQLIGCAGDSGSFTAKFPESAFLIPATARSCLNQKQGLIDRDVSASYFQAPGVVLNWPVSGKQLNIAYVKFSQSGGGGLDCTISGDTLAASYAPWYATANKETVMEPNSSITLDCPLACGGLASSGASSLSLTVEVVGFSQDVADPTKQEPQRAISNINVISSF